MNKPLLVAATLSLISGSAFASKSRLEALGQNKDGSNHIGDARNLFLNPASIHRYSNYVTFEWGNTTNGTADSNTAPKPEGGIVKPFGNSIAGLFFGTTDDEWLANRTDTTNTGFLNPQNTINLFLGNKANSGSMKEIQYGINVYESSNKDEQTTAYERKQNTLGVRLGAFLPKKNIETYVHVRIQDKSEASSSAETDKYEGKVQFRVGGNYEWKDYKIFGEVKKGGLEYTTSNVKTERSDLLIRVGAARDYTINNKTKVFMEVFAEREARKTETPGSAETTVKDFKVPGIIGIESQAKDWLTLRGSITQEFKGSNENAAEKKKTTVDSTSISFGATMMIGDFEFDGLIGQQNSLTGSNTGVLDTSNLLTRVSVSMNF